MNGSLRMTSFVPPGEARRKSRVQRLRLHHRRHQTLRGRVLHPQQSGQHISQGQQVIVCRYMYMTKFMLQYIHMCVAYFRRSPPTGSCSTRT